DAFGAEGIDPRLRDASWAAEALLDATPPGGWPPLAGGWLSRRTALSLLAMRRLRLGRFGAERDGNGERAHETTGIDTHRLLKWSLSPGGPEALLALRAPERAGLAGFLGEQEQAGLAGQAVMRLVESGHGADAVPFGVICAALWSDAERGEATFRARGRAERWFGLHPPLTGEELDTMIAAYGTACEEYVSALLVAGREAGGAESGDKGREARRVTWAVLDRAAFLTRELNAEEAVTGSRILQAGLDARFTAAGRALAAGSPESIAEAVRALDDHGLSADPDARVRIERARMGRRLAQWLATDPPAESQTVAAAIQRQVAETGWVDQALEHIEAGGDHNAVLAEAYDALAVRVREHRRAIDRSFAETLAVWTAAGTDPGTMLTVESFLARVVRPVVAGKNARRVLLLLLDGMSAAIATELAEELRRDWAEYDPVPEQRDRQPRRRAMAAALPTLTTISRTSLFAGRLMAGGAADEERHFRAHRFWGRATAAVFHKDDLRGESAGVPFGPELTEALADDRTHVAVVLNTIDDRLAKEQRRGHATWELKEIIGLRELLREAAGRGMAVIITSDHGHVVDRHGRKVAAAEDVGSARHRTAGGALAEAEIELSGPRVVW
ncbi:MAG: BREX-2 system phosphatase PglZ, partial [Streptosporangiales bacterium]|nr:BREX-2 system phosphatase PglZ [Streptosporangiales bacterium]